jgi:hypothetical protein
MPGYMIDEVKIRAWNEGKLLVRAAPKSPSAAAAGGGGGGGWGRRPVEKTILLPGPIDATSAQALMTVHGQLYVRINDP